MTGRVRVRMYRQGLGDCFLLTFSGEEADVHVLIDCGVLLGTPNADKAMATVVDNIRDETSGNLTAIAVTHEHWDHISGFHYAKSTFDKIQVRERWLAWTEKPGDELADKLSKRKEKAKQAVELATERLRAAGHQDARRFAGRLTHLLEFYGIRKQMTTAMCMDLVKSMPVTTPRYCRPDDPPFTIPGVPGVRVYAFAPPRDERLLKKSDPTKRSSEVYELSGDEGDDVGLLASLGVEGVSDEQEQPFTRRFRIPDESHQKPGASLPHYLSEKWRTIEDDWLSSVESLALRLDSDTNNTCLVLAFELVDSGRVLLFPGDAQVGNWLSWEGLCWEIRDGAGIRTVTTEDLLARTVLYKVGHHGSHNATLREKGLELMTSEDLVAMIPVNCEMALKQEWNMPFPPLLKRLNEKTRGRILQADRDAIGCPSPIPLSQRERAKFEESVDVKEGWIDYTIEL